MLHLAATRALRRPGRFQQQQRLLFARFSSSTDGGRRGGNGSSSSSSSWWHQHLGLLTIAGLAIADLIVLPTTTEYINDFKGAQAIAQGNGRALLPSREASDVGVNREGGREGEQAGEKLEKAGRVRARTASQSGEEDEVDRHDRRRKINKSGETKVESESEVESVSSTGCSS